MAQLGKQLNWQYLGQSETSAHPFQPHTHPQLSTSFLPSSQYLFLSPAPFSTIDPSSVSLLLKAASLLLPQGQELSGGGEQEKGRGGITGFTCFFHTRSALEPLTSSLDSTRVLVRGQIP